MATESLLGISVKEFWDTFFADEAEFGFDRFWKERGEVNVARDNWKEPDEAWAKECEEDLPGPALLVRKVYAKVQMKGNPFVKEAPTTKNYFLIEKSDTRLHVVVRVRTTDVPYCDSFCVEEEWQLESPSPSSQPVIRSCVVRVSFRVKFYKSTMMKGTITKSANSESEAVMKEYNDKMYTKRGIIFQERKKPKPATKGPKIGHMVESSKKMQKEAARKRLPSQEKIVTIEAEPEKKVPDEFQEKMLYYAQEAVALVVDAWQADRTTFLLVVCLFMLFVMNWRIGSLQGAVR